jgi:methyltransferase (TIGR00027 family)
LEVTVTSKGIHQEESMANPASQTAVGPISVVAVEQYYPQEHRLVEDALAYQFLPSGVKVIVQLARWRPARQLLINLSEKTAPGIWGSQLCRKRYIEDKLRATMGEIETVVILGAGLDTRAYRMAELAEIPAFEVDLPENSAYKRARLHELYAEVPHRVQLVPIDFERQDLKTTLAAHGYHSEQTTFFVWEGVTQYLSEAAVRKTFDFLSEAAAGSQLVFTYVRQDFMDGVNLYGAARLYRRFRVKQEVWQFGMLPEQVAPFLDAYGWRELEQVGSQEFLDRYIRPSGREMPVSEMERSVYAEKI